MQYIRPSHNTSPSQHVPRGGAAGGPRAAPASSWHVREDGGCGPRGPNSPGTSPAGGAENQVHAVEGDSELHVNSGFPHRRIPGRLQSSGQRKSCQVTEFSSSNSCSFCIMMLKSVFFPRAEVQWRMSHQFQKDQKQRSSDRGIRQLCWIQYTHCGECEIRWRFSGDS